jgi:hypothetical protein
MLARSFEQAFQAGRPNNGKGLLAPMQAKCLQKTD